MRMLVNVLVCLVLVAGTSGCMHHKDGASPMAQHCPPPRHAQAPSGARAPEDLDRLFGARVNAGDVDGVVALYEPTATLVRQDGSTATGAAAVHDEIAGLVALHPHITLNVVRVVPDGGDLAIVHDDWMATGTDPKGKHLRLAGHASEVVHRGADGEWRFVIDDPNARDAAPAPHHPTRSRAHRAHSTAPKR